PDRRWSPAMRRTPLPAVSLLLLGLLALPTAVQPQGKPSTPTELIHKAISQLVAIQEPDGAWPYEGVHKPKGKIPVGYRVGGTALVGSTLLLAAPANAEARAAIERALPLVLKELNDPGMAPSTAPRYDVRVWGHACALEFFCNVRSANAAG